MATDAHRSFSMLPYGFAQVDQGAANGAQRR
jgi:hypothetical protein